MVLGGCEMTREQAKSKIRMSVIVDVKHIDSLKKADEVTDQIFDYHEAQLKAKENDLERQDMIIKCLSMDLDSKEKQLKAKDEEIKGLGCRIYHAEGYINDLHNNPKDKKFYDKKARSIVAMLFWEWKKHKRMYELTKFGSYLAITHLNNATLSKLIFQQAYKMLKDTK